jgi:hypothetical protein
MEKTNHSAPADPGLRIRPLDEKSLYRVEIFSDEKAGKLLWLKPVDERSQADFRRPYVFKGSSPIMTPMGPQEIEFLLKAQTLAEALIEWPVALQAQIETRREAYEEARRKAILAGAGARA